MGAGSDALWVIASLGQADGELPAQRRALFSRVDAPLRPFVRSRVRAALAEAVMQTEHALDEQHVHRLAFLMLRGVSLAQDDVAAVRGAFAAELARVPPRAPRRVASLSLLSLALLSCAALAFLHWAPDYWLDRSLMPTSRSAFARGGRPDPGSPEVAEFFAEDLPDFVVALDAARSGLPARQAALKELTHDVLSRARALFGADAASFLEAVLTQSQALGRDGPSQAVDAYLRSVDAFNAALERQGLGYYLDAEVVGIGAGARVYLSSFAVNRVHWFKTEQKRVRALRLVRHDSLNFARGVLGFTRPHIRDALVLEERVDSWLIQSVLPALAEDGRFVLSAADPGRYTPRTLPRLEQRAADEARKALKKLAGACSTFAETSQLFARRARVFRALADQATRAGMRVSEPLGYDIDVDRFVAVRDRVQPDTWRELEQVADALDDSEQRACFRALREPLLASVEGHEIQHRLDFVDGTLERLPMALERRVGPLDAYGLRSTGAERALAETSAYLAELARGRTLVKLNLAMLAQHALEPARWGSAEYFAALVIFDGLVQQLGLSASGASSARAPERVANALGVFMAMSDEELSRAAARLWADMMGRPLPNLRPE